MLLNYEALIKAGKEMGACDAIEHFEAMVKQEKYQWANAILIDNLSWTLARAVYDQYKGILPTELTSLKWTYGFGHRKFEAMEVLKCDSLWMDSLDWNAAKKNYDYTLVKMIILKRRTGFYKISRGMEIVTNTSRKSGNRMFLVKMSKYNTGLEEWHDIQEDRPSNQISINRLTDPDKAKTSFVRMIQEYEQRQKQK